MKTQDSPNTAAVREGLGPYYPTLTMRSHFDPPEVAELLAERDALAAACEAVSRDASGRSGGSVYLIHKETLFQLRSALRGGA